MKKEIERVYWSNGKLSDETPYINGKAHGLVRWWYPNGKLSDEILYKNDVRCGAKICFKY